MTRDIFEQLVQQVAAAAYSFAEESIEIGAEETVEGADMSFVETEFEAEARALALALERLAADPSIGSTDRDGIFTYEDPILANAALAVRLQMAPVGEQFAIKPGEELTSKARWILMGVRWYLSSLETDPFLKRLASIHPDGPIKTNSSPLRIAVVGDAGQLGYSQDKVLEMMLAQHKVKPFDFAIHLGDVYFAANIKEMDRNFLVPFSALRNQNCRLFTLCGNHDLYYGAEAYFNALKILGQPGRYFAIENEHWRVVCLDTSLGAVAIFGNDGQLDDGQLAWLKGLLELNDGKRLVLLSHHFIISGWDTPAPTLQHLFANGLQDKLFAWYWGHEHRAAAYNRDEHSFFGASLGNGAYPEKWSIPSQTPTPAWYSKSRCTCFGTSDYWPHGYAVLEFHPDRLLESIHLEGGESLVSVLTDAGTTRDFVPASPNHKVSSTASPHHKP